MASTQTTPERPANVLPGLPMLLMTIASEAVALFLLVATTIAAVDAGRVTGSQAIAYGGAVILLIAGVLIPLGLFVVQPNQAVVIILFGRYLGSERADGWFWTNPFTIGARRKISLRIRNFNSDTVKVNDHRGNPVEIAAVVVWRVIDSAKAVFDVDDFKGFVAVQAETAVRHLATSYPYDTYDEDGEGFSLSGNVDEISAALQVELTDRLAAAGVEVLEARLSHLAYAPEIAGAMLRRQQALAVVAARQKMVEGAVGMVEMALNALQSNGIVQLDEERKAHMVSNLLVVLTGDQAAHPVINAGSLY